MEHELTAQTILYMILSPVIALFGGGILFFLRRLLKQLDQGFSDLREMSDKVITTEVKLDDHIKDENIHTYSRRLQDVQIREG